MPDSKNNPIAGQIPPDGRATSVSQAVIRWPAIFSGFFVTMIVYTALMCLGLALGGGSLYDVVQNQDEIKNLGIGAALWTVISAFIALYAGGHVSGRVAGLISTRVGRTQGLVIASVFFAVMFTQVGIVMGVLSGGLSSALTSTGSAALNSQIGQEIIEDAIGDLTVKTESIGTLTRGVASRLIRGDEQSAINFLAVRTGLTPQDANLRIDTFKAKFKANAEQAALTASRTLRKAGWTLFATVVLGCCAGMLGGALAANYNLREPVSEADHRALREGFAR